MTSCPTCQREVQEAMSECPHCGVIFAKLQGIVAPMATCPACQRDITEERNDCPHCGLVFGKWKGHASQPATTAMLGSAASKQTQGNRVGSLLVRAVLLILVLYFLPDLVGKLFSHDGVHDPKKPKQVPDFQLLTLEGIEYNKQSLSGQPALLFFWAPWCPYCQAELPKLAQYYQQRKPAELRVLAFGVKDTREAVASYINNNPNTFPFPSVYDVDDRVAKAIGVNGVPRYFLLDSRGNIVEGGYKEADSSGKFVIETGMIGNRIEKIIESQEFKRTLSKLE